MFIAVPPENTTNFGVDAPGNTRAHGALVDALDVARALCSPSAVFAASPSNLNPSPSSVHVSTDAAHPPPLLPTRRARNTRIRRPLTRAFAFAFARVRALAPRDTALDIRRAVHASSSSSLALARDFDRRHERARAPSLAPSLDLDDRPRSTRVARCRRVARARVVSNIRSIGPILSTHTCIL
jgi:hypothetical protein